MLGPASMNSFAGAIPPSPASSTLINRNVLIAGGVVLFHVAAIWAFHAGLLRRAIEVVVPVQVMAEMLAPPAPKIEPQPPAPQPKVTPVKQPVITRAPAPSAAPQPMAIADPTPSADVPIGTLTPQPPAPPVNSAPAAPAPPAVQLPSTAADYLQNPRATYPPLSRRMAEQGLVLVRVLVGADGHPQKTELKRSSGYERLDKAALDYVMKCRYVPGKVGGVAQTMWYDAPVNYVLD
jgi:periplasmic protein TonB